MKTIDTCGQQHYSPLIPAIKAMCEAGKGEKLEIIMDDAAAFNDIALQTGFLLPRKKWNYVVGTNWM